MEKNIMMEENIIKKQKVHKKPTGISILAILGYISAVIMAIVGAVITLGLKALDDTLPVSETIDTGYITKIALDYPVLIGVVFLIIGIVQWIIARDLNKGKDWARYVLIVGFIIALFSNLAKVIDGNYLSAIGIFIDAFVIWYLTSKKKVLNYFNKR